MEIFPGIHVIRMPLPFIDYLNVYVLNSPRGRLLIDSGMNLQGDSELLLRGLAEIGCRPENVEEVVATHRHLDHFGLVPWLRGISGARLSLHRAEYGEEYPHNRLKDYPSIVSHWLRVNGVPSQHLPQIEGLMTSRFSNVSFTTPERPLLGGECIPLAGEDHLEVIWSPGHAPGHICLYYPEKKVLFAGDHILTGVTPSVGRHPQSFPNPLQGYLASFQKILQLDIEIVLPAHGPEILNWRERVRQIMGKHHNREEMVWDALASGAQTAYQVSRRVLVRGDEPMAIRAGLVATLSWLEHLESEGEVTCSPDEKGYVFWKR